VAANSTLADEERTLGESTLFRSCPEKLEPAIKTGKKNRESLPTTWLKSEAVSVRPNSELHQNECLAAFIARMVLDRKSDNSSRREQAAFGTYAAVRFSTTYSKIERF
jgi:hypothetical protein